jgi:hypothetical protein
MADKGLTVEVGENVLALDLLAHEADLAVTRLVAVEISEVGLEDTAAEAISGDLSTSRAVDQSLASDLLPRCVNMMKSFHDSTRKGDGKRENGRQLLRVRWVWVQACLRLRITDTVADLLEVRGGLDVVPLLAGHGVRGLLLGTLLALREPLPAVSFRKRARRRSVGD